HGEERNHQSQPQDAPAALGDGAPILEEVELLFTGRGRRSISLLQPALERQVVHQKKLSSTVTMSPGSTTVLRSTLFAACFWSSSRMMFILSRDARSLKPPATEIALRTVMPGENG